MAKEVFLSGFIDLGVTRFHLTNLSYSEQHDLIKVSDLSTPLGITDYEKDKVQVHFTAEAWLNVSTVLPARGDVLALVLDFEGLQMDGDGRISGVTIDAVFDTVMRVAFTGVFIEAVNITYVGS